MCGVLTYTSSLFQVFNFLQREKETGSQIQTQVLIATKTQLGDNIRVRISNWTAALSFHCSLKISKANFPCSGDTGKVTVTNKSK